MKSHYEYTLDGYKRKREPVHADSIYMTDLQEESFPSKDIIELYHVRRWDNETAYFDIKDHLETEKFNSGKYNIVVCELYGKIFCYSVCGIIYDRVEELHIEKVRKVEAGQPSTLYDYIPNMKYICDTVRMEHQFLQFLTGKSKNLGESAAYLS